MLDEDNFIDYDDYIDRLSYNFQIPLEELFS